MAKDQTVPGITGKPVPKPTTAKQQYELEKKRRMEKHLGKNVGGTQYKSDTNPYYNPRAKTFREFLELAESVADKAKEAVRHQHQGTHGDAHEIDKLQSATDASISRMKKKTSAYPGGFPAVKKEETEIDEAKVEAGASDVVKKDIRSRRFVGAEKQKDYDAMGSTASSWVSAARLRAHKAARGVKKEEIEIDEAKVEAGMTPDEKRRIRTGRNGFTNKTPAYKGGHPVADYERRGAHRERDELNKDAKSIRKGKLDQPQFQGRTGQERIAAVKKAKGMK